VDDAPPAHNPLAITSSIKRIDTLDIWPGALDIATRRITVPVGVLRVWPFCMEDSSSTTSPGEVFGQCNTVVYCYSEKSLYIAPKMRMTRRRLAWSIRGLPLFRSLVQDTDVFEEVVLFVDPRYQTPSKLYRQGLLLEVILTALPYLFAQRYTFVGFDESPNADLPQDFDRAVFESLPQGDWKTFGDLVRSFAALTGTETHDSDTPTPTNPGEYCFLTSEEYIEKVSRAQYDLEIGSYM
jgi:hypothetical protein